MRKTSASGHISAIVTILIWGTTFISTKILLTDFSPVEILFARFFLGLLALWIACPKKLGRKSIGQELLFAAAGLCGVCLYYLLENIALTHTLASNVSVIVSVSPFFIAIFSHLFTKNKEPLRVNFFLGFLIAMTGICLISFTGSKLTWNPLGDILAFAAALIWAVYSLLTQKISSYGDPTILTTRRIFTYGMLFMLPALWIFDVHFDIQAFQNPQALLHLGYLGVGASALCFVTWNYAVKMLGPVKTSVYIYIVPAVTIITSSIVLNENITGMAILGTALTFLGLFLSEWKHAS